MIHLETRLNSIGYLFHFFLKTLKTLQEVEIKDSEYGIQINTYAKISRISMKPWLFLLLFMRFLKDRKKAHTNQIFTFSLTSNLNYFYTIFRNAFYFLNSKETSTKINIRISAWIQAMF